MAELGLDIGPFKQFEPEDGFGAAFGPVATTGVAVDPRRPVAGVVGQRLAAQKGHGHVHGQNGRRRRGGGGKEWVEAWT